MARWIIILGVLLVVIGVLLHFIPGLFKWFGKLPGDIRIEGENTKVFIPIATMLIISIVLTILINVFKK